jgi:putative redox protein
MKTSRFVINGHSGKDMVVNLDLPEEGYPKYYAIYVPCFTCTKDIRMAKHIAKRLTSYGVALVRFDFPGLGESDEDFERTSYSTNMLNIRLVAEWLEENFEAPKLGIGHSMGGSAMMKFVQEYDPLEIVVTIAAPSRPDHLRHILKRNVQEAEQTGSSKRTIGGLEFTLTKEFFDDLLANANTYELSKLKKPILVLHSPDDDTVPLDEARVILEEVRGQRSYVMLNNFGHLIMDKKKAQATADIIYNWAKMYL